LHPDQCEAALDAVTDSATNQHLRQLLVSAVLRTGQLRARAIRTNMALWSPDDEDFGQVE
jgi:hypothetical protein